ncbi:MAG: glutamate-1-semialdehyde 2,1-aminomutase, partial [Planctomycetales bacterium]|nr:glutamate-1-semialdehyde 2,1-aminomutase [Planctomycetales bacterium]
MNTSSPGKRNSGKPVSDTLPCDARYSATADTGSGSGSGGDAVSGKAGSEMFALIAELFPLCRSITGDGLRQTLRRLQQDLPLQIHEVPSGTQVFDWRIPEEWNIRDARLRDPSGRELVRFEDSNLSVVNYSCGIQQRLSMAELQPHLHSLPDRPQWIPYRTSYYQRDWGFCLPHALRTELPQGQYEVSIDATHDPQGSMSYGECVLPGRLAEEVLISCHVCHPSLANDNLSALAVAHRLACTLAGRTRKYTYRFLFLPGTIGAIAWLSRNPAARQRIAHGLVLALLGDAHPLTYKRSCHGRARIDQIAEQVLQQTSPESEFHDFSPEGYDERQYGSPGIHLPVGRLSRSCENAFPQYHTSADNLDFIAPRNLSDSLSALQAIVQSLEDDRVFVSRFQCGELQFGKRELYSLQLPGASAEQVQQALRWTLNLSTGQAGLQQISRRSGLPLPIVEQAAEALLQRGILAEVDGPCPDDGSQAAPMPADSAASSDVTTEASCPGALSVPLSRSAPASLALPDKPQAEQASAAARALSRRAHAMIPGGCHTYAKGDDQFPTCAPRFFVRGRGCHVEDSDGRRFIEYGMGLRSVGLGHAYPAVVEAAYRQMQLGSNFTRPATIEVEVAEQLVDLLPAADMVKFAKNGSDATTAAIRLARAYTGRSKIALCVDHPFYSVDDWFISGTPMSAGIPRQVAELNLYFRYNDLPGLERLFREQRGQIACLIMEAATYSEPLPGYLQAVQSLCQREGVLFVLDEMITGLRWHLGGAQAVYGLQPDLSTFGKALGNGFSVAALAGRREVMQLGGLEHQQPRVFLLSATHGAETHCLAAAQETLRIYREQPVIETLYRRGSQLRAGIHHIAQQLEIEQHFFLQGRDCNLIYVTQDASGQRSQELRTLLLQELIRRHIFAPSLVVSYSHQDSDISAT